MSSNGERKPQIAGAICGPRSQGTDTANSSSESVQPRQPSSLQGLLRFAMDATKTEDAPNESNFQPMEDARRKFLEQAIHSLTVDVVEILVKQIRTLEKVAEHSESDDDSKYTAALETISEYVCDIDTANDFHKIGGFVVIPICLKCKSARVRADACNLLAELCQNNPYCQKVVLESEILPLLIDIVESDADEAVIVKALYAISCIVRQNSNACVQFIQYRGVQIFLEALRRNKDKINTKICFLLDNLCNTQPDFKSRLCFIGYVPILFTLIQPPPRPCDEHVLKLLLKLIEDNSTVANECRQNKNNAKEMLENYLAAVRDKEEYSNEEETCNAIYSILFAQK